MNYIQMKQQVEMSFIFAKKDIEFELSVVKFKLDDKMAYLNEQERTWYKRALERQKESLEKLIKYMTAHEETAMNAITKYEITKGEQTCQQ